jgi:hypothetical protein
VNTQHVLRIVGLTASLVLAANQTACAGLGTPQAGPAAHQQEEGRRTRSKPDVQKPTGPAIPGGTVTSITRRDDGRYRLCSALDAPGQDGRQGCSMVKEKIAGNCFVGAQWPTCADRSDRSDQTRR